jgi:hypothetical protein
MGLQTRMGLCPERRQTPDSKKPAQHRQPCRPRPAGTPGLHSSPSPCRSLHPVPSDLFHQIEAFDHLPSRITLVEKLLLGSLRADLGQPFLDSSKPALQVCKLALEIRPLIYRCCLWVRIHNPVGGHHVREPRHSPSATAATEGTPTASPPGDPTTPHAIDHSGSVSTRCGIGALATETKTTARSRA